MAFARGLIILLLIAALPATSHSADCLTGTVTAQETTPGSGIWRYCATVTYNVAPLTQDPSHFDLLLPSLVGCTCACQSGYFSFASPAGTSPGTLANNGNPCTVQYSGSFSCSSDPTLPSVTGPHVKWDTPPATGNHCDPDLSGTATLCFLSTLPPGDPSSSTVFIKTGASSSCSGTVTGRLPMCNCATSAVPGTWGRLKTIYR